MSLLRPRGGLLGIIYGLVCFWRRSEERAEIQRDLQNTYEAHRARADHSSRDYQLKRDLEALERENNENR